MVKRYFNHPMLGHPKRRESAFWRFLDVYGMSIDVDPPCVKPQTRRAADALWSDFVAVSEDANRAAAKAKQGRVKLRSAELHE